MFASTTIDFINLLGPDSRAPSIYSLGMPRSGECTRFCRISCTKFLVPRVIMTFCWVFCALCRIVWAVAVQRHPPECRHANSQKLWPKTLMPLLTRTLAPTLSLSVCQQFTSGVVREGEIFPKHFLKISTKISALFPGA